MNYRDYLQKVIYVIINPFVEAMIKIGVTPNFITSTGFVLNLAATAMIIFAGMGSVFPDTSYVGWGGAVILFAGLFDMLDGRLARLGHMETAFGALLDSTLDRYSELFTLFGIFIFFFSCGDIYSGTITFLALVGSIMVSYVRARAEGVGIECKVGIMQRPERVVLTALGAIFCGLLNSFWPLIVPMIIIAILANYTAFIRIRHCHKTLKNREQKD